MNKGTKYAVVWGVVAVVCCAALYVVLDEAKRGAEAAYERPDMGATITSFIESEDISTIVIKGPDGTDLTFEKFAANQTCHIYGTYEVISAEGSLWTVSKVCNIWRSYDEVIQEMGE